MRALAEHSPTHSPWQSFAFGSESSVREVDPASAYRVLIADDQWEVREALRLLLKSDGYETKLVEGPKALLESLEQDAFDLVLLDLNYTRDTTSGREGLDVLGRIRLINQELPVVVMTAWSNVDLAVEAMRGGACDFLQKPWDNQHVLGSVRSHVQRYRTLCKQRRDHDREQDDAIATQRRLLPEYVSRGANYEIASAYLPARTVGGDYFDVLQTGQETAVCIADVAGKGVPAALLMANLQATLRPLMQQGISPAEVCDRLNRHVNSSGKFISFFHALLDPRSGQLRYVNAGHVAPVVVHRDGSFQRLLTDGAVLGHFDEWNYRQGLMNLESGSRLLLFTDGLVDAIDSMAEEFGEDRLVAFAVQNRGKSAEDLKSSILGEVMQHCDHQLQDDATLLVIAID